MNIDHLAPPPELPAGLSMICRIGLGGAGDIFMVQDITGKFLALKSINSRWQQKEFDAVSILRDLPAHPAVTQIYQTGNLPDGNFFYTMELADNAGSENSYRPDTLAYRIESDRMTTGEILSIMLTIAYGIRHLHDHNVFHGDIKPENIIFINGQAKLSDFGTLSADGNSGTAGFIPADPQSGYDRDCYALAKTLYCAYSRNDAAKYPSPPETINPGEFKIIRKLYITGCADHPKKRFSSITNLINSLELATSRFENPEKVPYRIWKISIPAIITLLIAGLTVFFFTGTPKKRTLSEKSLMTTPPDSASPEIDQRELNLARTLFNNTLDYNGEIPGLHPRFRQIFEAVYQTMPEKLDNDFSRQFRSFYQDYESFTRLRDRLNSPEISDREFLRLYNSCKYMELYYNLRNRSCEIRTEQNNKPISQIIRLYFANRLNTPPQDGSREE